jgi:glycosyltransferase involved in cell wall biosynthesis
VAAFPRSRRLWVAGRSFTIAGGVPVRLLPFINVHPLKWLTAGIGTFGALLRWSWRHRRRRRVVHCVNLTMPPGLFILLAARLTGARALVSVLDVCRPGVLVPDTLYRRADFALQRWLLPKFDGWMVVSQAIGDDLVPGRTVCRIEGGVAPEPFKQPLVRRNDDGIFRLLLAGGLEPYNGVHLLLEALPHLPPDCQILLAGHGSLVDAVRAAAERDPRVVYHGFLDFDDVLQLYRSADLLLNLRMTRALDTRYFFPSKLMEFLASGVAVLSTCTGHVEEEYGDLVYLLRDETPEALAAAIRAIRTRPPYEREALGRSAREFMLANKTWPKQGEKLIAYIRDVVFAARD